MKSFVALLSIKPHSPSVCPLYATVGAYRTFKYCLPIVRLCLTSMVTVTPKKIIEVYNKNWARSLGFNWRPSSSILVKILKHSCAFLLPQCWFGYYLIANKSAKSERKTFSRKFNTNSVCFNDLWWWRWRQRRTSKKAMDLLGKTTILRRHHAFCYISLLTLCY